jgi:hypothetical protein
MLIDYMFGHDDFAAEVSEREARVIAPKAFRTAA